MKMPVKVVNFNQSDFVKGSNMICNVQSTGRNNEKTKVHVVDFKSGKGKRKGKLGQLRCSPYVDRITDMDEVIKDDENVVAQSIIIWGKDKGEIIWETIEGHGMHLESARTLAMRTKCMTM
ncbi:unnamed protein product [Lactuca saligna]|uniref:Uncharacterized protein n=1 Tax=Lactuca saligna TaxID=75948 RepID=A0AA35YK62_LACSI|nr:unnamed protein product [Lactuca saligna]